MHPAAPATIAALPVARQRRAAAPPRSSHAFALSNVAIPSVRSAGEGVLLALFFLTIYFSSIVTVDIFYSVFFVILLGYGVVRGLRFDRTNMLLVFFLVVYNLGGLISYQPYIGFEWSREFVIGTAFVATTAIFYCLLMNENTLMRLKVMRRALMIAAFQCATLGIIGWVNLGGLGEYFSMYGRASGTFRDPNVFGPFLILPALYLLWDLINGGRWLFIKSVMYVVVMVGIFLSFSRGAWGAIIVATLMTLVLAYLKSPEDRVRRRILAGMFVTGVVFVLILAVALSIDTVRETFQDRFVLQKDYDSGPSGRFGNQKRAIVELLDMPFGHGPNRFGLFYEVNPHNVYIMAFSSYGWLGGMTFIGYIAATLYIGARTALLRTPFQAHAILVYAALFPHILQGLQIDTDRWRHLFLLYGLCWGLAGASRAWLVLNRRTPDGLIKR